MLKRFKMIAGACVLAGLALPAIAQQPAPDAAQQRTTPKRVSLQPDRPKYLVAFGRVLARTDRTGTTRFNYQSGRLVSEVQPDGTVGTYQYDTGKFTGVVYTDGRYITLTRSPDGRPTGLVSNTGARVKFAAGEKPTSRAAFMAIQEGMLALRHPTMSNGCINTDDDRSCTIVIQEQREAEDDVDGGGGGISNPPGETPDQCRVRVCIPAATTMAQYCKIAGAASPVTYNACLDKGLEYFANCYRSCDTNDWSWLENWNFYWGK